MTESILVDAQGLPLYIYKPDTPTTSHVSGQLAALWPPLLASAPTAATGITGTLTAVGTTNGQQVSYNGHFLYTFIEDSPGRVTGQGVQNFFVATPTLATDSTAPISGSTTPPTANGYGY
jgi:predicted lipoprotein with Yx(FWY)xxD motif